MAYKKLLMSKMTWKGKIAIKEQVNINPHLKHNKILLTLNDGYSKTRDLKE